MSHIVFVERNWRLYLDFMEPEYIPDKSGSLAVSLECRVAKSIDLTAHIERAVRNVLADGVHIMRWDPRTGEIVKAPRP